MVVAFCGHSSYTRQNEDKERILAILEKERRGEAVNFLLGEYGGFDRFAYECAKEFKAKHQNAKLIFVTPYHPSILGAERTAFLNKRFDEIVYHELENVPIRFAISHRNRKIIDKADIVIAYISHTYGGAYTMYKQAKSKGKLLYNIADFL